LLYSASPSALERWVLPSLEVVTVGLPFCVFKLLTGAIALASPPLAPLGYALLALGAVDAVLNLGNLLALLTVQRRISGVCLTDITLRALGRTERPDLGLALDVFLSFALVAIVVGFGLLARLPSGTLMLWNLSVVLNVLGAGIGRLVTALRKPA